jgi:predicted enzyme related to lactoylglutathione lyase
MLTTSYVDGAPNWTDLAVTDVTAAADFYGALFGWQFQSAGPDSGGYGFLTLHGATVAAVGPLTEEDAGPAWTIYFQTSDADETAVAVQKAGGTVRLAPTDVATLGRTAAFTDPTGAEFAVWQPGEIKGLGAVTDANTLAWTELYTTDAAAATGFYRDVFDWQTRDEPMGPVTYTIVTPAAGAEKASQGGIMQLPPDHLARGSSSEWHPYFEVADCDATFAIASSNGASAMIAPMDAEGVGRLAMLADPQGAVFAVITSVPMT